MKKSFWFFTGLILCVLLLCLTKISIDNQELLSKDDKFKTWIDIHKSEFYDNEVVNMQVNMKYIGKKDEINVYIPRYPFTISIYGDNGFQSIIEAPNTFGIQEYTFERDDIITMDCSNYGYNYLNAFQVLNQYEQIESRMGVGGKLKLPAGNYTLTLKTWYEDDLSGELRHELYASKKIIVKPKNNRKSIYEVKSEKNFKLEANLDKNIYEVDEYITIWSSMTYCGDEDSIFYPDVEDYPMYVDIYDENHDKLQSLERVIYDLVFDYWFYGQELNKDKTFYYKPFDTFILPAGKYLIEFIYRYPNDAGVIITDTIEMNFEVVLSL